MKIKTYEFGMDGAVLYKINNENGLSLSVSNYGARVVDLIVDRGGQQQNLILGFESATEYSKKDSYIGASIGRVAGRISKGQFSLNEKSYLVSQNDNGNCLHGGINSFDQRLWESKVNELEDEVSIEFSLVSPDGDNGFPGNLKVSVTHTLTTEGIWKIDYQGTIDEESIYNPTNHVYFNLNTHLTEEIGNHFLFIQSDYFGVLNEEIVPTGELRSVTGTPFDFRDEIGTKVSQGFDSRYDQNVLVDGYDHPFLLNHRITGPQIKLVSADKHVSVEIETTEPSVVIYTTNMIEMPVKMRESYQVKHGGITFETQSLPDAINHEGFGSILISPEKPFSSTTTFKITSGN